MYMKRVSIEECTFTQDKSNLLASLSLSLSLSIFQQLRNKFSSDTFEGILSSCLSSASNEIVIRSHRFPRRVGFTRV